MDIHFLQSSSLTESRSNGLEEDSSSSSSSSSNSHPHLSLQVEGPLPQRQVGSSEQEDVEMKAAQPLSQKRKEFGKKAPSSPKRRRVGEGGEEEKGYESNRRKKVDDWIALFGEFQGYEEESSYYEVMQNPEKREAFQVWVRDVLKNEEEVKQHAFLQVLVELLSMEMAQEQVGLSKDDYEDLDVETRISDYWKALQEMVAFVVHFLNSHGESGLIQKLPQVIHRTIQTKVKDEERMNTFYWETGFISIWSEVVVFLFAQWQRQLELCTQLACCLLEKLISSMEIEDPQGLPLDWKKYRDQEDIAAPLLFHQWVHHLLNQCPHPQRKVFSIRFLSGLAERLVIEEDSTSEEDYGYLLSNVEALEALNKLVVGLISNQPHSPQIVPISEKILRNLVHALSYEVELENEESEEGFRSLVGGELGSEKVGAFQELFMGLLHKLSGTGRQGEVAILALEKVNEVLQGLDRLEAIESIQKLVQKLREVIENEEVENFPLQLPARIENLSWERTYEALQNKLGVLSRANRR